MATPTPDELIAKTGEEVILNFFKAYSNMDYSTCQGLIKDWSDMRREHFETVHRIKQKLYSRRWDNALLINFVADLRRNSPVAYDLYCLLIAIIIFKYADNELSMIKVPHRKNPNPIPKNLEYKVKVNFAEITILKQQYSWQDVAKIIKKNHRHQFQGYKLTASYLRRVYNKITEDKNNG